MGQDVSVPSKAKSVDSSHFGLLNFGNTCYCNSVIQALYHCEPFKKEVLKYPEVEDQQDHTILTHLCELFYQLEQKKKKSSVNQLKRFIIMLRKANELFNNREQHDAHEFLNYILNTIDDTLRAEMTSEEARQSKTWIDHIFKGTLTNETRCLCCETVRSKDEDFIDLSVDIDQNTSITKSLKGFSQSELLCKESKYYCEVCCSKQEATKSLRVKVLPRILVLHLKRFKYMEHVGRFTKLSYRVAFPLELKLFNTSYSADAANIMYDLIAVIIHCGGSPNQGHYITLVKNRHGWILYDDDIVEHIEPHTIEEFFGVPEGQRTVASECGYILFYEERKESVLK